MAKARKIKGIDCNGAAGAGIKRVLEGRFREMAKLRDTALNWNDPEGVHSMRVSSRRLRSALRDFTPYLRKRGLASSLGQIKRIADALGEVRDQDVAIDALEKLRSTAPQDVSAVITGLINIREVARNKARLDLNRIVARAQLKQLNRSFVTAVDAATAPKSSELAGGSEGVMGRKGQWADPLSPRTMTLRRVRLRDVDMAARSRSPPSPPVVWCGERKGNPEEEQGKLAEVLEAMDLIFPFDFFFILSF